ncbi:STAS-like domain-containing protein [Vogesella indigofera]|uniref:STAS-like domain-containing protein n=1 Tax=Vogesella indigofera TaxID=45465 RepID=UPI00357174C4
MVRIEVAERVKTAYTYEDGEKIFRIISKHIKNDETVQLSFSGIDGIPSSFANGCFVKLLEDFSLEKIKSLLLITNSTKQINQMIKSRLNFENERRST